MATEIDRGPAGLRRLPSPIPLLPNPREGESAESVGHFLTSLPKVDLVF